MKNHFHNRKNQKNTNTYTYAVDALVVDMDIVADFITLPTYAVTIPTEFKELVEIIEKSEREAERVGDEVTYLTGQSAKNRAMELYKSITGKSFVEHVREKCDGDLFTGIFALGIGESASSLEDYATGDSKTVGDHVAEKTGAVAGGAALGAAIGSIFPGVGTAFGAGVGAAVGFIASWF